jgi:hypothetical protein
MLDLTIARRFGARQGHRVGLGRIAIAPARAGHSKIEDFG